MKAAFARVGRAWAGFKLFRDYAVLAAGQVGSKLLGFVAFAWLARVLNPALYGELEYVVGLAVFFAALVDGGLGAVGVRRAAKDPQLLPTLAFQIPVARLLIAALAAPAMMLFASVAMRSQAPPGLVFLFALSLFAAPWRQEWLLQASERMTDAAISQIVRSAVFVAGVWLVVKSDGDLARVGWVEIAAVAAMGLYCIAVQHLRITPFRLTGSWRGFWSMMREGAAVSSTNLVWALIQTLPLILIGALVGGAEVGLFAAAARLAGSIAGFSSLYHFNLFPAVSRAAADDRAKMAELMRRSFRVAAWGGVLGALTLTLFADELVRLAFGAAFASAGPVVAVMIWTLPIVLCSGHARWGLTALGEQKKVLLAHLAGLSVLAVLCPWLGSMFGSLGYAIGATAGPFGIWVAAHIFARMDGNNPPPFHLALRPVVVAAAAILAAEGLGLGVWARLGLVFAAAAAAPLIDPRLIPDVLLLGRAKARDAK